MFIIVILHFKSNIIKYYLYYFYQTVLLSLFNNNFRKSKMFSNYEKVITILNQTLGFNRPTYFFFHFLCAKDSHAFTLDKEKE